MKTKPILLTALLAIFLFTSCGLDISFGEGKKGNGEIVKEKREVTEEFTEVSASEGLHVYVTQADDFDIRVEADENIIDLIGTDIKNGKLRIHAIKNIGNATKKVFVSLPEITALMCSSGAHLNTENQIEADQLQVDGSSGAILTAELSTEELEIDASSGANLKIFGKADNANVDVSSGGNINAKELEVRICRADASSGGNLSISVSESLTADANSGGNIGYSGNPDVQKSKSFSGNVYQH